jgi:hypothetical protein
MLSVAKADRRVEPGLTLIDFSSSPLIFNVISPCGRSFDSARLSIRTRIKITPVKIATLNKVDAVIIIVYPQMT